MRWCAICPGIKWQNDAAGEEAINELLYTVVRELPWAHPDAPR